MLLQFDWFVCFLVIVVVIVVIVHVVHQWFLGLRDCSGSGGGGVVVVLLLFVVVPDRDTSEWNTDNTSHSQCSTRHVETVRVVTSSVKQGTYKT